MKIYENIVIGNFLYGLGLSIGARSQGKPNFTCVNLLQQTPIDESLADVMISGAAVFRLLEFKRAMADKDKEKTKLDHLQLILDQRRHLIPVSLTTHWYIEIEEKADAQAPACPYINQGQEDSEVQFEEFIHRTAQAAMVKEPDIALKEQFKEYIATLVQLNRYSGSGSGALLVAYTSGGLRYIPIADVTDIGLTHRQVIEQYKQADKEIVQQELKQRQQQALSRAGRGRSIGGRSQ